jgi:exo-1,4-beta-D-glucosaminidase
MGWRVRASVVVLGLATGAVGFASGASADVSTLGLGGWRVQSSAVAPSGGGEISQPGFDASSWLSVKPDDAGAVGTEVGALVQDGKCPQVFYSTNMANCFGYMNAIGPDTIPEFSVPWWFRTSFRPNLQAGEHAQLIVNGVVGQADVWLNGREVATQETVQGDYTRYTFDVTKLLQSGNNVLALEVYPNDPTTMYTLDDVDWNQIAPDNNTGIQFPIELHVAHALAISNVHVVEANAEDLSSSALTLKAEVSNETSKAQTGSMSATVTPPEGGGSPISLQKTVELAAGATRTVSFTPAEDTQLDIVNPQVWWPYQMGAQPLYGLKMSVSQPGVTADSQSETFGIRTITSRLVGPSPMAPSGARQFLVNGHPFVFRGGGWAEDLFLRYSSANTAAQIALIKNLGLNGIRTEGKQMPAEFYEQMDRAGILIDGGFQCCDAWAVGESRVPVTKHDYEVLELSARTIGQNLRNHPSVLNFSWSDNAPTPRQEAVSLKGFSEADFQDPLISSAEYNSSERLGPSGEKEGPYDWVPPSYWYDTTHYNPEDPTRTNVGGAWAFDSEASAGDTVPTLDSIERFMSPYEQAQLWKAPAFNQYHANYEAELPGPQNEGYAFGTLFELDQAISNRYGAWSSLQQYVEEAQVANYETQRAEFEAYIDHSVNKPTPSTGIDYWQLNKGWPSLLWDLYNNEYDEAGSFFGAKKANETLHVLYAYDTGDVAVDNLTNAGVFGLTVQARVYSLAGKLLDTRTATNVSVPAQGVASSVLHPKVPAATAPPQRAKTYFVQLLLMQGASIVDRNTYWLSTQPDVINWAQTVGFTGAVMTQYANLTELQSLPPAEISVSASTHSQPGGPDGADTVTDVTITNTSKTPTVGFFLRADIRRGSRSGVPASGDNELLPAFWSDDDITLWPGESETLAVSYQSSALDGESPVVSVGGWNMPTVDVPAP